MKEKGREPGPCQDQNTETANKILYSLQTYKHFLEYSKILYFIEVVYKNEFSNILEYIRILVNSLGYSVFNIKQSKKLKNYWEINYFLIDNKGWWF